MVVYEKKTGNAFKLSTVKNLAGKTGWLDDLVDAESGKTYTSSCLVCSATGKTSGKQFVAVVSVLNLEGQTNLMVSTMNDIKYLFDTYAK